MYPPFPELHNSSLFCLSHPCAPHVSVLFSALDVLQGVNGLQLRWEGFFLFLFFFWTGWGPLCNLVNGALHVGNVSEARVALRLAGRANSPIAQPLPSPQKPGVLRRSGEVSIATATSGMELRVNVWLLSPSTPHPHPPSSCFRSSPRVILFSFFAGQLHLLWECEDKTPDGLFDCIKPTWLCFSWKILTS